MTASRVLAIDAGKTGCRAASYGPDGRSATTSGPGIENVAAPGALDQIRRSLRRTVAPLLDGPQHDAVCLGLTGVLRPGGDARAVADLLLDLRVGRRVIVTSDSVTTYCGALGLRPGVVVAAGTGAIGLAVGSEGRLARVDGWGYLLDDAGSAYAIGRAGLREALRAEDGRGGSSTLLAAARATFGSGADILAGVYGSANPARTVAGFAREVDAAARAGDRVAAGLLASAGRDLARTAVAAARQVLDVGGPVAVSWQGGVFRAGDRVLVPFLDAVRAALPQARPEPPRGDALDGAAALARGETATVVQPLLEIGEGVAT